ncbi:MAG TPA: GMC family oxidoreductase N-terminal domain-containing protein, partial [Gemmatimonadales bacterium]|nr:GMC family oxidoreductase N-terminal domain-containing protein [Gemmatimonadales bacterium]
MSVIRTDVLVIGTGFGAAAPALRLALAGVRVVMLEKGPSINPFKDFRQTQDPKYILRYIKGLSGDHVNFTYAEGLGGGSGFYEMVSLRAPSLVFQQRDENGRLLWPAGVDRAALDPYYDIAERMLKVEQIAEHEVPKSGLLFSMLMRNLGYSCDRARYAVQHCIGSGFCVTGCIYGNKQSLHLNYLPQAVSAGARVECGVEALSIHPLADPRSSERHRHLSHLDERYEVLGRRSDGRTTRYRAKIVVLGAGTVGTARLLLASRPYLGLLSDHVGRHIAINGSVKAAGILPEGIPDGDMFTGRSHCGMISYHFLESHGITISSARAMPINVAGTMHIRLASDPREPAYWGQPNVDLMKIYRRRVIAIYSLGLTPPVASIALSDDGRPVADIDLSSTLLRYHETTERLLHDILLRNGCQIIKINFINGSGQEFT